MKCLVPAAASLTHTIDAFHESHNPGFFARCLESRGLFHVGRFIVGEHTVEERGFDVEVLDVPVQ